ncbi:hypothetical protein LXA43DRAFT_1152257 [Ganoderma leucocontextum]|nr:hypothetical protein LXA43DRAFT_1152257 [Ganoderma leucocontextum]
MAVTQSQKAMKYGEKDARLKEFRQKHQPPVALKRAVGNDEELMALCPSYGQENLGDQAEPLSPESKDDYVRRKAREKEAKAQAIRSKQSQAKGPSKRTVKRKPCSSRTRTFPPDLPGPIMTIFSVTPLPPVLQPSTTHWQGALPRDTCAASPSLPWHALSYSMPPGSLDSRPFTIPASMNPDTIYQLSATEVYKQYAHNAAYSGFHALPRALHTTALPLSHGAYVVDNDCTTNSPITTPSLESYHGSPWTYHSPSSPPPGPWAESPAPSSYTPAQLSAAQGGACEDRVHAVYQGFFLRRSSGGHESPIPVRGGGHTNVPPVVPHTAHGSQWPNTVASTPDLLHPLHSPPTVINSPDLHMHYSTGTAIWTSTDEGHHWGYQRRKPASKDPSSTTGAPGVDCATSAGFNHQHTPRPYPSHSNGSSEGHISLNQSLATVEVSAVARYAREVAAPPIVAAASHQVWQHDVSAMQAHTPHNNGHHVSTMSYAYAGHVGSTPIAYKASTSHINASNQHFPGASTMANAQQRVQSTHPAISVYSELTHALVDHYAGTPSAMQAIPASGTDHAQVPSSPQIGCGAIGNPSTNVPGPIAFQVDSTDDEYARIFEGCFDGDSEPLSSDIVSLLLSEPSQQLWPTSTWGEASI